LAQEIQILQYRTAVLTVLPFLHLPDTMMRQPIVVLIAMFRILTVMTEQSDMMEFSDSCTAGSCASSGSAALLQVSKGKASRTALAHSSHMMARRREDPVNGSTATLDEDGYQNVTKLCCGEEMMAFMTRVAQNKSYQVCDIGGMAGLALWFDCPDDGKTFELLEDALETALVGNCSFVTDQETCPERSIDCPAFPSATFPPCGVTRPVMCCRELPTSEPTSLISLNRRHSQEREVAKVGAWDCEAHPDAIQVLFDSGTQEYRVAKLDIEEGEYNDVYRLPLSITEQLFGQMMANTSKEPPAPDFNSVGINPKDSRMYGTTPIGDTLWLVRFGQGNMVTPELELVAKLPQMCDSCEGYNAGTFSPSGTYYLASKPVPYLTMISGVHEMEGISTREVDILLEKKWETTNLQVSDNIFTSSPGNEKYQAQALQNHITSIQIKVSTTNDHVRFGLTSNADDTDDGIWYRNGCWIGLFPHGLYRGKLASMLKYKTTDTFKAELELTTGDTVFYQTTEDGTSEVHRCSAKENGHTALIAKIMIYISASFEVIEYQKAVDTFKLPTYERGDLPSFQLNGTSTADIVADSGTYDGEGEAEYAFLLDTYNKLLMTKMPPSQDEDAKSWELTATGLPLPMYGYGAGWNFNGQLFFASNEGKGVYEIDKHSINIEEKTVSFRKVGESATTSLNDGANCLEAPSPWQECAEGYEDVEVLPNGSCPDDTKPLA